MRTTNFCHTCSVWLTLPQARLHMWNAPNHDVELDPEEVMEDQRRHPVPGFSLQQTHV